MFKIAVPAEDANGFESIRSGHFGRAPYFAIVEVEPFGIAFSEAIKNDKHEEGHEAIAALLADAGVNAVVAKGIGTNMAMALSEADITVYREGESRTVGEVALVVARAQAGGLPTAG